MRVLLMDNALMVVKNNRKCCVEGTGIFAKELVQMGHEVCMFGQYDVDASSISNFDIEKNGIGTFGYKRLKNKLFNYIRVYLCSVKHVINSDFVYIFYPSSLRFVGALCTLLHKPFGLYVRGDEGIQSKYSDYLYRHAYTVMTVSKSFTDYANKVSKKNNAQSIRPMLPYDERDICKSRTYERKEEYKLLFLCRIAEKKGLKELLHALALLRDKDGVSNLKLTVAGDGTYLDDAKNLTKALALCERVDFLGQVSDNDVKAQLYKDADLYVLPTYYREGFPRTLYEAMIFGAPIITTMVAGIPSLMIDSYNCIEVEPKSVDDLRAKLLYAVNNYSSLGKIAENAAKTVAPIVDSKRLTHAGMVNEQIFKINK